VFTGTNCLIFNLVLSFLIDYLNAPLTGANLLISMTNIFLKVASPLEQFNILPLFVFRFTNFDLSITNQAVFLFFIFFLFVIFFLSVIKKSDSTFYILPTRWQSSLELAYKLVSSIIKTNFDKERGQFFFPLFFSLFCFIVVSNVLGLIPYSFTIMSHFITTFAVSLTFFIGINIICIKTHGIKLFSLFLPSGTSFVLAFLLVPIEVISYVFKPISLSLRLFANIVAGHTLLKVMVGFAWSLLSTSGITFLVHYLPILLIVPLIGLEFGIALIQAFIFTNLTVTYLNDAINLH